MKTIGRKERQMFLTERNDKKGLRKPKTRFLQKLIKWQIHSNTDQDRV